MTRFGLRLALVLGLFQTTALLAQDLTQPYVEGQVLVRFQPGLTAADRAVLRGALLPTSSQAISLVPGLELVRTRLSVPQAIATLTGNPNIVYVEPDYILQPEAVPNDYYIGLEWGLHNTGQDIRGILGVPDADIDMVEAWDLVPASAGPVVVAVIDSGTQLDHEDLQANIWVNPGEIANNGVDDDGNGFVDDVNGWDFFSYDNDPSDESGHGTHVAGTIAALTNNGIGIAGICGDNCEIMPLRFLGPQGGPTSAAVLALQYAVAMNVKVSNNSWGGGGYSQSLINAIQQAAGIGHIFVTSSGNSGIDTDVTPQYPSSYDNWNIISVAATTNQDLLASFSNFGATTVDIGAPGFDVASLYIGNQYYWLSGTSMAAPHVAGVVALLQAAEPSLTAQQIIDRIYDTARPLPALNGVTTTGAMLNAYGALSAGSPEPNTPPSVTIMSGGGTYTEGQSVALTAQASDAEDGDLTGSIAWLLNGSPTGVNGGTYNAGALGVGTHSVTAEVTDSDGNTSSDSTSVTVESVAPPPPAPPAMPESLTATDMGDGSAMLGWQIDPDSDPATHFLIEREELKTKGKNAGTWNNTTSFTANQSPHTDSPGSKTVRYRIAAVNDVGTSAMTGWVEVDVTGGGGGGSGKCHPRRGC